MIDNKKINTLFITITLIEIVTIILGFTIGSSFYFCLKPFIYIGLALFTYLFIDKKYLVKREKRYINQITIMAIIGYMLLYILTGIIFGFANNPLVMKGKFFFLSSLRALTISKTPFSSTSRPMKSRLFCLYFMPKLSSAIFL